MFGEGHHDSIVKRGFDEALACRDMLAPAPVPPSLLMRVKAWIAAVPRAGASAHPPLPRARKAAMPPAPDTIR